MIKIAIMASGRGSNFKSIHQHIIDGHLKAEITLVISNNSNCDAINYAKDNNINTLHISTKTHYDEKTRTKVLLDTINENNIDLIVLAGYMKKLPIELIRKFPNKIINIHPSLLPKFGGKNMYGMNIHRAVVEAKENESGVTIHFVNENYDEGQIIDQAKVSLDPSDSAEDVAQKVLAVEHSFYWKVIAKICNDLNPTL